MILTLPSDTELQRMTDEQLAALWRRRPKYTENPDWVRVASELRHRDRFKRPNR